MTQVTIAAIREKIPDLESAEPGPEFSYGSLPLCVIDAVFSIGVHYGGVKNVVKAWCAAQTPNWPKYGTDAQARHTITDLIQVTNGCEGLCLAKKFFGDNKQRTSSIHGILKADAVVQFAKALKDAEIDDLPDIQDKARVDRAEQAVRKIPGQNSGLSFHYFLILAGDHSHVKPDRMICRFVAEAAGLKNVSSDAARDAVVAASHELAREFPNLTPSLLDNLIWKYQRAQHQPVDKKKKHCRP